MNFKQFLEQAADKPWVAKRKDVIDLWKKVRTDVPLNPIPVPYHHKGNRFDQDGVRITGSSQWINSVLGRLKPLLVYDEHPLLDIDVKYRQVQRRDLTNKPSFACYINIIEKKKEAS
jgi:hypothetical protein